MIVIQSIKILNNIIYLHFINNITQYVLNSQREHDQILSFLDSAFNGQLLFLLLFLTF